MSITPISSGSSTPAAAERKRPGWGTVAGLVLALTTVVTLMLLAFATPSLNSGAKDLPLAVSGPAPAVAKVTQALEAAKPGAFETTTYASAAEAADAIQHRDAIGGISVGADGVTIQTASAAGAPYAQLLRTVGAGLEAQGQKVTYTDLAPWTKDDPMGAGLAALALPLAFGGAFPAVLLTQFLKDSRVKRLVGAITFSVLAGLVTTAILQYGFHSFDGSYLLTASGVSLGIAAISLTLLGLESVFGFAGFGLGAVLVMFISNPLAGMAAGPHWLPQPWGEIGQWLPLGAAGTVIRSAAFFDGNGAGRELLILGAWAAFGLLLSLVGHHRSKGEPAIA
ncbi:MAG: ABC transporter permease [Micrococcales bacterium]|nr:ABC transporter permease [Micrococcales bacterium]